MSAWFLPASQMVPSPARINRRSREIGRYSGQSLIEVTVGIVALVPLVLFLIDFSLVVWSIQSNDTTCRDAVRAAACGDPADATARAQAALNEAGQRDPRAMISNSVLVSSVDVQVTGKPVPQIDEALNNTFNPGGPVTGTVTATTEVEVRPFVLQGFLPRKVTFRSQHSCPITYVMPAYHPAPNLPSDNSSSVSD